MLLEVRDGEDFPADLLCLHCASAHHVCYVKTTNLDGAGLSPVESSFGSRASGASCVTGTLNMCARRFEVGSLNCSQRIRAMQRTLTWPRSQLELSAGMPDLMTGMDHSEGQY